MDQFTSERGLRFLTQAAEVKIFKGVAAKTACLRSNAGRVMGIAIKALLYYQRYALCHYPEDIAHVFCFVTY